MTKICVFSDSHGNSENMIQAIEMEKPDIVIHLGDGAGDMSDVHIQFPELTTYGVAGNCDGVSAMPVYRQIKVEKRRIFATHGHLFDVKNPSLMTLCTKAMEVDAHIVLFGHTHTMFSDRKLCMDIMNPGTIGVGTNISYGVLLIDGWDVKTELHMIDGASGISEYLRS